jgi:hypothetical protein
MLATVSQSRGDGRLDTGLERGRRPPTIRRFAAPVGSELAGVTARRARGFQARLEVGRSDDPLEHEAERVAERLTTAPPGRLRRTCACGGTPGPDGECAACKARRLGLQRKPAGGDGVAEAPAIVHDVLRAPGVPLEPAARSAMERGFGRDFGVVRVHAGAHAADSAHAVGALAYTVGSDIVFAQGRHSPGTPEGRKLLAHELAHVVQQDEAGTRRLARKPASEAKAYGPACTTRLPDPCQMERCSKGDIRTVLGDLDRGLDYASRAAVAARASPLAESTVRALDWYFNDHSEITAREVASRLDCIGECLLETSLNSRFGCHPDYANAFAYVCVDETPICSQVFVNVCFTDMHFRSDAPKRARTAVHECAHRVGMSLGKSSFPDVYYHRSRFAFLDTFEALLNSDSFAGFAGAIGEGRIPVSVRPVGGLSGGAAFAHGAEESTWYARYYTGVGFQHPVLGFVNPTLGIGISVIGESTTEAEPQTTGPTELLSVLGGVHIADPRPGAGGAGHFSLFGGPALAINPVSETPVALGAEAGVGIGYRWRWLDVAVGVGYTWDPTRAAGMEHVTTAGAGFTLVFEKPILKEK